MKEKTHLIILNIHPRHIFLLIVIRKHEDIKVECREEAIRSLVPFLENEVCQFGFGLVGEGMSLVDAFGYPQTARVYALGEVDILPCLHSTLSVHVEFDIVGQSEMEGLDDVADEVFESGLGGEAFACVDAVVFVEDLGGGCGGGGEVAEG